eukprot:m.311762 g.311762  ORF g.311762 m.311762 type:complete len:756 (+) comp19654_c1_seq14:3274-5541(+)
MTSLRQTRWVMTTMHYRRCGTSMCHCAPSAPACLCHSPAKASLRWTSRVGCRRFASVCRQMMACKTATRTWAVGQMCFEPLKSSRRSCFGSRPTCQPSTLASCRTACSQDKTATSHSHGSSNTQHCKHRLLKHWRHAKGQGIESARDPQGMHPADTFQPVHRRRGKISSRRQTTRPWGRRRWLVPDPQQTNKRPSKQSPSCACVWAGIGLFPALSHNKMTMRCAWAAVLVVLVAATAQASDSIVVTTDLGDVRGLLEGQAKVFRGIPYAEPPVQQLRWRPPQPHKPWAPKTFNATAYGPSCIQTGRFDPPVGAMSEDCLFLNVYVPQKPRGNGLLPVMFWVHGGGYESGTSNESRLNGTWDVGLTQGIVIVTINYRLNVFGFLGGDELRSRDPSSSTGNYGLQDQRLALSWVSKHIRAFGGDPQRVFLVGESAGAGSVSNHLVMKKSWGLFHAAGMESGAFSPWVAQTMPEAQAAFDHLKTTTGCPDVACLESKSSSELLSHFTTGGAKSRPTVDGIELLAPPRTLMHQGHIPADVAVVAGSVGADCPGVAFPPCALHLCTEHDFQAWALQFVHNNKTIADTVYTLYAPADKHNSTAWYWAMRHAGGDFLMSCPARRTAQLFSRGRELPVGERTAASYLYSFTHVPFGTPAGAGSFHSSEIPFVFHVLQASESKMELHTPEEVALSTCMVDYWVTLAATGAMVSGQSAAGVQCPQWPEYTNATDKALGLDIPITTKVDLKRAKCDFWDTVTPPIL